MAKKIIRLTEGDLHNMIMSAVNKALSESKIEIKKENEGKFNATKKATGKSTEELTHSKNPVTKKRAIFAQNAKKWNKGKKVNESFEDDFNNARDNFRGQLFGFEMKNPEGDWQYGDVDFDPNTMTMSCMGATIDVDPDMTVDQNLEALYDELMNRGFTDGDE